MYRMISKFKLLTKFKFETRDRVVIKNTIFNLFFKFSLLLINFALIRISLQILDKSYYGIWITIFSTVSALSFLDIGIGNGLRNKLSEAFAKKEYEKARVYISTTYFYLSFIMVILLCIISLLIYVIKIGEMLKISNIPENQLKLIVVVSLIGIGILLVLKLLDTIYIANNNTYKGSFIYLISQIIIFIVLYCFKYLFKNSLLKFSIIFSLIPILIYSLYTLIAFNREFKCLSPSVTFFNKHSIKDIMTISVKFFLIQLSGIFLFSIDNILITNLLGSDKVTEYNVAYKYFNLLNVLFNLVLLPSYTMFTYAFSQRDFKWIQRFVKKLLIILSIIFLIGLLLLIFSKFLFSIWLGNLYKVNFTLNILMFFYFILLSFAGIYNTILYATNNFNILLYVSIFGILFNIVFVVILIKVFHFGILAIPIAFIIYVFVSALVSLIKYLKIKNSF